MVEAYINIIQVELTFSIGSWYMLVLLFNLVLIAILVISSRAAPQSS